MRRIGLIRLVAVATITTVIGFATPAAADETVPIHSTQIPTTAQAFQTHLCTGPLDDLDADEDGWHFVTTGTSSFTSVTLKFHTPGGDVTVVITGTEGAPSSGPGWVGFLDNAGAAEKHAYLITDAGWELFEGTSQQSSAEEFFNVSHTCPGTPNDESPSPSPEPSDSQSTDPGSPSESTPPLPRTGTAITSIALSGLVAIAAGAGLLFILRRRRDALMSSSSDE